MTVSEVQVGTISVSWKHFVNSLTSMQLLSQNFKTVLYEKKKRFIKEYT